MKSNTIGYTIISILKKNVSLSWTTLLFIQTSVPIWICSRTRILRYVLALFEPRTYKKKYIYAFLTI